MKKSNSLNYGELPQKGGGAKQILDLMKSKGSSSKGSSKSFRNISSAKQVSKKFDSLLADSNTQLSNAKKSCPAPENPYKYLLQVSTIHAIFKRPMLQMAGEWLDTRQSIAKP